MTTDAARGPGEGAALRALRVLEAAAQPGGPHALGRIAQEAGIAKPSTHRILRNLAEAGYVVGDGAGTYGPGPRAHALSALLSAARTEDTESILRQLRSDVDETVHVALRSGDHAVYVHKAETDRPYRMASRLGGHLHLHCTAIGKAILAHASADDRDSVVAGGLPRRTANTITGGEALAAELDRVRAQGCAVDDEENEETIRCIAAPILDRSGRAVGGVSVSTIAFQVPRRQLLDYAPRVIETATLLAPAYT